MTIQYHQAAPMELQGQFRAASDGSTTFEGYTAVFGQWSKDIKDGLGRGRSYREIIQPGAFRRTLGSGRRISLVVDHNDRQMISSYPTGQLRMAEDTNGLHVESPWPRTDYADNARALFDSGERLGMSMLFATPAKGDTWNPTYTERSVSEAILKHASVLATMEAAYDSTTGTFRALADLVNTSVEDVDAVMDALRDGRRLNDGEFHLMNRLVSAVRPEVLAAPKPSAHVLAILAKLDADPAVRQLDSSAAEDSSAASEILSDIYELLADETDDATQAGYLTAAAQAMQSFISSESAEIGTPEDIADSAEEALETDGMVGTDA